MKIVALTDIHGSYKKAEEIIHMESAEIIILGGDLTTIGSVKEAEEAIKRFQSICPTILAVAGNMDMPQHDALFERLGISINGRGVEIDTIGFFGVSAAPISPLRTPYELSEEEIASRIETGFLQVKHSAVKVFVPHAPPYGTKVDIIHAGYHVGSTAVRDFVELVEPHVVICGHIHEARGQDMLNKSKIVNCGSASKGFYGVIEIGEEIGVTNHRLFP